MPQDPDLPPDAPHRGATSGAGVPDASELRQALAGLAHELNNPLAAIMGFAQLLLKKQWLAEDRAALEMINNEAIRSAAIVHNLLVLSGRRTARVGAARALDLLVVSPDATVLAAAEAFLSSRGHAVITARSSDMALRLAAATSFDVVACDAGMCARQGAPLETALRETRGCAGARFVTMIPRLEPPAPADPAAPAAAPSIDVDALRHLVEGD